MSTAKKDKGFKPFLTKAEQEELAKKARLRRKAKARAAAAQLEQDIREAREEEAQALKEQRWRSCLGFLALSNAALSSNPWLLVNNHEFARRYQVCLDHLLKGSKEHSQGSAVKDALSGCSEALHLVAVFSKAQPAFYFLDAETVRRQCWIGSQVALKNSSPKGLYMSILTLLTPTATRAHLHSVFVGSEVAAMLLKWVVAAPTPSDTVAATIFQLLYIFSTSAEVLDMLALHPNLQALQLMTMGVVEGLAPRLLDMATHAQQKFAPVEPDIYNTASNADDMMMM